METRIQQIRRELETNYRNILEQEKKKLEEQMRLKTDLKDKVENTYIFF